MNTHPTLNSVGRVLALVLAGVVSISGVWLLTVILDWQSSQSREIAELKLQQEELRRLVVMGISKSGIIQSKLETVQLYEKAGSDSQFRDKLWLIDTFGSVDRKLDDLRFTLEQEKKGAESPRGSIAR